MEEWERLLVDTESLIDSERRIEFLEETDELRRAEEATSSLAARLMGARGAQVSVDMRGGQSVQLVIQDCSTHWLRGLADSKDVLISLAAILRVKGLPGSAVGDFSGPVSRTMSFASAVRFFADKHRDVVIFMGATSMTGKIVRVESDCLDIVCSGEIALISFTAIDYISEKRY
ncbi:MAG: hypothetical protein IKS49_06485 [Actinomycetaceae bacterium]|nr:hypothetical protein [Actinomycetaceae bacterium]